jgi:NAD(P)-dependent dehydrogenase (short-subunit alcohol dehydrogenase family)
MAADLRLDGRVALITGSSRGIGRSIAMALAAQGASVVISSRKPAPCDEVVDVITAAGGKAIAVAGNAGNRDDCKRIVDATMDHFGRLDILVNNAATNPAYGLMLELEEPLLDKVWSVNVKGPWWFARYAVAAWMNEHGGAIINVASTSGMKSEAMIGAYAASKAAVISMTSTWARELGGRGIRVNAISPGLVRTDFSRALIDDEDVRERLTSLSSLGRAGEPDEIGGLAVFLASDASSYLTGANIVIDGGTIS